MVEKEEPMVKATRFSFVNNKDTTLTAPDKVVTVERKVDSDADEGSVEVFG